MNESKTPPSGSDDEQLLRDNLRVPALSAEALARIRRATEAEWRRNVIPPARHRWMLQGAAAAVVVLAIAGGWTFWNGSTEQTGSAALARLARAEGAGVIEQHLLWRDSAVTVGATLGSGDSFEARGGSLLALNAGGNLRFSPGSEFKVMSANSVRVESGEMYVDIPPGQHADASFVVITSAGEFHHVGTQFAVAVSDGTTRLRVREGSVQWHALHGESTVSAGTEVLIDRDQNVTRNSIDSSGQQWSWTETMAPDFNIENRPLAEFLDWVARETGRKLVIADENTRRQLATIRMHGDVQGLAPLQALEAVMASTSLRFDLPAGAIRVSFAGEPPVFAR